MAVVGSARELHDRRRMTENDDGTRTYSRTYGIEVDNPSDGGGVVLRAPDLPQLRGEYVTDSESDPRAIVTKRQPRQVRKTNKFWEVEITYEYVTPDRRERDPLQRQVSMSFDPDEREVPVTGTLLSTITITPDSTRIYQGPIRNSMRQPFPTQPMVLRSNGVLSITRNEDSFSPAWAMQWSNAVNSDPWAGAEPRQVRLKIPTCAGSQTETVDEVEIVYYPVHYEMHFREEGHDLRILDEGPDYQSSTDFSAPGFKFKPFTDGPGRPYIGKLDGKGRPLTSNPGMGGTTYSTLSSTVDGVFLQFPPPESKLKPFGELGLPEEFI